MFWTIVGYLVATAVFYALLPKPKMPPPGVQQVTAPTAQEGREVPVLFGTRDITGPNIVWYGDVSTEAIRVKGGKK